MGTESLEELLRTRLMLGGHSRSAAMIDWAGRELNGYDSPEELPVYRNVSAPLQMDGSSGYNKFQTVSISAFPAPEFAREAMSGDIPLMSGVGEPDGRTPSHRPDGGQHSLAHSGTCEQVVDTPLARRSRVEPKALCPTRCTPRKTVGRIPCPAADFRGGQGRGRTVDLPSFSRTLVPTELPGRKASG